MAIEKKILKNRPFRNARGQYNFEDGSNVGIDPLGKLDIQSDLYSTSEDNETNIQNITWPGNSAAAGGNLQVTELKFGILNPVDSMDIRFSLIDGSQYPDFLATVGIDTDGFTTYTYDGVTSNPLGGQFPYYEYYDFLADMFFRADSGCGDIVGRYYTGSGNDYTTIGAFYDIAIQKGMNVGGINDDTSGLFEPDISGTGGLNASETFLNFETFPSVGES